MNWSGACWLLAASLGGAEAARAQGDSAAAAAVGIYLPAPAVPDSAVPTVSVDTIITADTIGITDTVDAADVAGTAPADTTNTATIDTGADTAAPATADTAATATAAGTSDTSTTAGSEPADTAALSGDTSLTARMDARRGGGLRRSNFPDLRSSAAMAGRYEVFLELAGRAELGAGLTGDSLVTVLAPTDSAFAQLPPADLARLRNDPAFREAWLGTVLLDGSRQSLDLIGQGEARSLAGTVIPFSRGSDGWLRAGPARVVQSDLIARNGMLHGVDRVTLPETTSASP